MKVKELISILKKMDGDLDVYLADHDHTNYETNGLLCNVNERDQSNMSKLERERLDPCFFIDGPYCVLQVI